MTDRDHAPNAPGTWQVLEPRDAEDRTEHLAKQVEDTPAYLLVAASRRGRSHEHTGTYREDAFAVRTCSTGAWTLAVADGAGSCRLSRIGARIATQVATDSLLGSLQSPHREAWSEPRMAMIKAARDARQAVEDEARRRNCPPADLSCTLLVLFYVPAGHGGQAAAFQVGDGLVVAIEGNGQQRSLTATDTATWAGETRFLTSDLGDTWSHRVQLVAFPEPPQGFILASDGVADDLVPLDRNLPILWGSVGEALDQPEPGGALLDLLNYQKRGSFDDRTLVVARCKRSQPWT